jgi:hypothetical protein
MTTFMLEIPSEITKTFTWTRPGTERCGRDVRSVKCRQDWPSANVERRKWRRRTRRDFFFLLHPAAPKSFSYQCFELLTKSHRATARIPYLFEGVIFSHGSGLARKPWVAYLLRSALARSMLLNFARGIPSSNRST